MNKFFFFFLILFQLAFASAQSGKRSVSFEWEPIEGARSYEVFIKKVKKDAESKDFTFKSANPVFSGALKPGQYTMKLRSVDNRGVPGPWSPENDFLVPLESVKLLSPAPKAKITAKNSKEVDVEFQWKEVPGSTSYLFELSSDDNQLQIKEVLQKNEFEKSIPAGTNFTWKVKAMGDHGAESDSYSLAEASVLGEKLQKPKIEKPESDFVREVKWSRPDSAEKFDYVISKYNAQTKKWEKIKSVKDDSTESTNFDEQWTGGKYKFSIRAKADRLPSSDVSSIQFDVRNGDRSPAAEYVSTVRQSIDRITGWYGIASYLITQIKYENSYRTSDGNSDSNQNFNATGGTGRLGAGWLGKNTPWGFLAILDLSGFLKDNKPATFASLEASAVYRKVVGDRGEARFYAGLFYKEIPQVIPTDINSGSSDTTVKNYSTLGPHLGAEYWYSMTQKLGVQVHTHLYYNMIKVSTPSGGSHQPLMSTQYGFLGSYRLRPKLTGLAGVSYRQDKSSYTDESSANDGKKTTTTLEGTYLNFFAEYSF